MDIHVSNTSGVVPPVGGKTVDTPAEIKAQLTSLEAKAKSALTNLSSNTATAKGLAAQTTQNTQLITQAQNLQSEIQTLQSSGEATPDEINELQTQLAGLVQTINQLNSGTAAAASTLKLVTTPAPEAPAGKVPAGDSPALVAPLPNGKQPTAQDQAAMFLAPSLSTALFAIMEKVEHQKLDNIDVMRQFSWNSTANTEKEALNGAQATVLQGQLSAASQRATAIGTIVQSGLGIALGLASVFATMKTIGSVNSKYNTQEEELEAAQEGPNKLPSGEYQEQKQKISMARQEAINNELQGNTFLKALGVAADTLPQMASGIANLVAAGYTEQAAYAEAAKMLFQQAAQSDQSQTQTAQEYIQAASQDLQAFLQTFGSISSGLTQQA